MIIYSIVRGKSLSEQGVNILKEISAGILRISTYAKTEIKNSGQLFEHLIGLTKLAFYIQNNMTYEIPYFRELV
jgi:hypothetical protein